MSSLAFEMDTSAWPLVFTVYHRSPTVADCQTIERAYLDVYERRERFCVIAELRRVDRPDAASRKRAGELEARLAPFSKRYSIGCVMVVESMIVRGALTALRWLNPAVAPEAFVPNLADAARLAGTWMRDAELPLPEATRKRLAELGGRAVESGTG
jgi:hypothetical protein